MTPDPNFSRRKISEVLAKPFTPGKGVKVREFPGLTVDLVNRLLLIDPQSGKLWWRHRERQLFNSDREFNRWNARYANKQAFTSLTGGYFSGHLLGESHRAHRLIWFAQTGRWPRGLDHINGDTTDNRIANLREATTAENAKNMRRYSSNKSGVLGVYWHKSSGRWRAVVGYNRTRICLGTFATIEEAANARAQALLKLNFHENHGREGGENYRSRQRARTERG